MRLVCSTVFLYCLVCRLSGSLATRDTPVDVKGDQRTGKRNFLSAAVSHPCHQDKNIFVLNSQACRGTPVSVDCNRIVYFQALFRYP